MSLLTNQSEAAPDTPFWAPASGGGGGGGSVLNVSTINFNAVGSASNTPAQQNMRNGGAGAGGLAGFNGAVLAFDMDPGPVSTMFFGYNTTNNALQITRLTNNIPTSGALQVDAIVCSTINGAAPGGGGAAVSTFPDLTVSNPTAAGATLNLRASDTNLYEIDCVSSSVALAGVSIGLVGGRNQVYIDTGEVPNFYTSTIKGATGQISLNPTGTEQIRIGGVGAPGDITIATVGGGNINLTGPVVQSSGSASFSGAASISSLTVSSINGATPGGGSVISRTTVSTWSSGDILGDGTSVALTPAFTTLAGHLYSLQGFLYANASPNITSNACFAMQVGNIDRAYQPAIPLIGYSAAGTAGLAFGNNIPVSMTWRANTGAVNNAVYGQMVDAGGGTTSTSITATSALTLFDYGPVA